MQECRLAWPAFPLAKCLTTAVRQVTLQVEKACSSRYTPFCAHGQQYVRIYDCSVQVKRPGACITPCKCCPTTQHSTAQNKMAAGESPAAKKVKFSEAVEVQEYHAHPAADALTFHLLEGGSATELATEIDEGGGWPFQAEFFNQVFGDAEEIKGYQGLSVDIWLSLRSFHAWCALHMCCVVVVRSYVAPMLHAADHHTRFGVRREFLRCDITHFLSLPRALQDRCVV